jgi:glyoxylase-like metal-dependent hydrolase (beta-lactamase superfamily II)
MVGLSDDWDLEVLHVPGHSLGHLAVFDPRQKAAFVSDAIHGSGCPKADGKMALPVTYFHISLYLSTLRHLETLDIQASIPATGGVCMAPKSATFSANRVTASKSSAGASFARCKRRLPD